MHPKPETARSYISAHKKAQKIKDKRKATWKAIRKGSKVIKKTNKKYRDNMPRAEQPKNRKKWF